MTKKDEKFLWRVLTKLFSMVMQIRFATSEDLSSPAYNEADEIFVQLIEKYDK